MAQHRLQHQVEVNAPADFRDGSHDRKRAATARNAVVLRMVLQCGHGFEHVAKIAKRGRKRWLGLVFVTQLPQHLPRQIFGLVNS
jgi:hypothetical protein